MLLLMCLLFIPSCEKRIWKIIFRLEICGSVQQIDGISQVQGRLVLQKVPGSRSFKQICFSYKKSVE